MKLAKNVLLAAVSTVALTGFLATNSIANTAQLKPVEVQSGDVNILADIAVIDKNEILLATLASNKKLNADVTGFAKMMIDQHGGNLTQLLEIAHHLNISSLSSTQSKQLSEHGGEALMKLGSLEGDAFTKVYVEGMVKGHEAALHLIDSQLMKEAKTESVKTFLSDTRAAVVQHLDHAKKLQEGMK